MRNVLLVTGLAMTLFVSAAQAAECPKVIEIPLAESVNTESAKLARDCLAFRIQLVQAQNLEVLSAQRDAVAPAVYILRFSHDRLIVTLDYVNDGSVEYNREHFDDDSSQFTHVIKSDSPFYTLAVSAYDDLETRKGEQRPASVAELVNQVATSANVVVAARWPVPSKMANVALKAEGK